MSFSPSLSTTQKPPATSNTCPASAIKLSCSSSVPSPHPGTPPLWTKFLPHGVVLEEFSYFLTSALALTLLLNNFSVARLKQPANQRHHPSPSRPTLSASYLFPGLSLVFALLTLPLRIASKKSAMRSDPHVHQTKLTVIGCLKQQQVLTYRRLAL